MTTKSKSLRLNKQSREEVRDEVRDPLLAKLEEDKRAAKSELANLIWHGFFNDKQKEQLLRGPLKDFFTKQSRMLVKNRANDDDHFYINIELPLPNTAIKLDAPQAVFDAEREIMKVYGPDYKNGALYDLDNYYGTRGKEIAHLIRELNSVLLLAKTRAELATLWPPARELMGDEWVDAVEEPNTLPTLQLDALNDAVAGITKKAA